MLPRCPQCNRRYVPLKEVHRREGGTSILSSCLECRLKLDQPFAPDCHICFDGYDPFPTRNTVATLVRIFGDQAIWPLKGLGDKHSQGCNEGNQLGSLFLHGQILTVLRNEMCEISYCSQHCPALYPFHDSRAGQA